MQTGEAMLRGVRIVDLTSVVFGPYATKMMADLGAEVIKVEPPSGDQYRHAGRPVRTRGMGHGHMAVNVGKKSAALDLKDPEDLALMRDLLKDADVFIHNVRDKAIRRLGLDYESVRKIAPEIIYIHCVGFGSDGPYADLQAYDDVIQAATGTTTLAGRVDGSGRPRYLPSLIADKVAGLHGAYAMLAAIVHRLRTGKGQFVEVPMFETFSHFMLLEHMGGATFIPPTADWGYPRQLDPARQPFPTADGFISIVPYTDASIGALFEVLGAPHLLEQERFATPKARAINMTAVYEEIARLTPSRTTDEWCDLLARAQIPAIRVRDLSEMLDDPHLQAAGFYERRAHSTEGEYWEMRPPVRFFGVEPAERREPPRIGEHTEALRAAARSQGATPAGETPESQS